MFISHSANISPFTDIACFLANRYQFPEDQILPPLLELVIDNAITLELLEEDGRIYLIGVVVDPLLIHEDHEALALLQVSNPALHVGGTLAWDEEKQRLIFWVEVTSYTREVEFNEHLVLFLNNLDEWIELVPRRI